MKGTCGECKHAVIWRWPLPLGDVHECENEAPTGIQDVVDPDTDRCDSFGRGRPGVHDLRPEVIA